jgi:hypothetical protein
MERAMTRVWQTGGAFESDDERLLAARVFVDSDVFTGQTCLPDLWILKKFVGFGNLDLE